MYKILVDTHSVLRWILAISLIITLVYALYGRSKMLSFEKTRKLSLISLILLHLQFLIGVILYFVSPKVIFSVQSMKAPLTRFFLVEHLSGMLIGVVLITLGYSISKKVFTDEKKYNRILIYYAIGFLIILAAIPWPFYNLGTNWL